MKFDRSIWIFLALGIALRCVAINQPLVDAHSIRQCQTAAATRSLLHEPGFHLSSRAPWFGDLDARYILELPVYNYLVMAVHFGIRNLDMSGKLTTILLWAVGFICLQFIWRRILDSQQTFWANLIFVIAPLSVFYGQAFMPEMLVQALAFVFVWQLLRYDENPSISGWILIAVIGLGALLVKLPETAHLYLILGFLVLRREGWRALIRPRYFVAAIATLAALKGWSRYMDSVNAPYMQEWTSSEGLRYVIGPLENRLHFKAWAMAFLYIAAFVIPGPALLASLYGLYVFVRYNRERILGVWLISLAVFYLAWFGTGPTVQSYYNLPALAPLCALFGIGMAKILSMKWIRPWPRVAAACTIVLAVLPAIPIWQYLFTKDRQILAAALWAKENTQPNDVVLFRINHHPFMVLYVDNPIPGYYSERRSFIWAKPIPENIAHAALARSQYAIVTSPQAPGETPLAIVNRFRGALVPQPESNEWLEQNGFHPMAKQIGFEVFKKN